MRINKNMPRYILGIVTAALWCFSLVLPAKADICFLPTGICEQGAQMKEAQEKTCAEYVREGIYYDSEQPNMNCSLTHIDGCYECTALSCEERGYKLGPTNSKNEWPSGYTSENWDCFWCSEGGKYRWICTPKFYCGRGIIKNDANCAEGYEWVAVPDYGKQGDDACGECRQKVCPENTVMTPPVGCYECATVVDLGDGRVCYKCHSMATGWVTAAQRDAQYDNTCFEFSTKPAADSTVCYFPEEIDCGADQYKTETTINGKKMCKCYNYTYEFRLRNPSESNVVLAANGQSKLVSVISQRCGEGCEDWPYTETVILGDGKLGVGQMNNGNTLKIDGPINKSQTTDLNYRIKLTQTWGDEATIKELYINVSVEHDTCPENAPQFTDACPAGWKAKNDATSVTGEKCYKCYNDTCDSGFTNISPKTDCQTSMSQGRGNYTVKTTEYGSTCCEPKPDDCPLDYTKVVPSDGGAYYTTPTEFGSTCYKAKPDDCPGGYTNKGLNGSCPTDGHYDEARTDFGSLCCKKKSDDCPSGQEKSCSCGVASNGDKTPFGTQCYYCKPCCEVGSNAVYDIPGLWGSKCLEDTDCQSSSDYSLICVNKDEYGCGECKECGHDDWANSTLYDCKDKARRDAKAFDWYYIRANSGESCDKMIGDNCMKKDPHQTSACTGTQYPDVTHDSKDDPYVFYQCTDAYDGAEAAECTASGECLLASSVDSVGDGWYGEVCRNDNDCFESGDFPLYCFEGKCLECDKYDTCEALADDDSRFRAKYGNVSQLTLASETSSGNIRYAGDTYTLQEIKDGYKRRFFCTNGGECSQCTSDGYCKITDTEFYICRGQKTDSNPYKCPCYRVIKNSDGTYTETTTKKEWCP